MLSLRCSAILDNLLDLGNFSNLGQQVFFSGVMNNFLLQRNILIILGNYILSLSDPKTKIIITIL